MSQDYTPAIWIPTTHFWPNNAPRYVIVHGTGSSLSETPQNVAQFFQTNNPGTSTHYVIGRDGTVVQCVAEANCAWGNGVISTGADSWWTSNPNNYTISIEHVNDSANSTPLTAAQQAASFALIKSICERHGIPMRPADATGGITGHYSIDPVNRAHCPGNYPWNDLWAALGAAATGAPGGNMSTPLDAYFNISPDGSTYTLKSNSAITLGGGALALYKQLNAAIGLPTGPVDYSLQGQYYSGFAFQRFERGIMVYDPQHKLDSEPGMGDFYLAHINSGPFAAADNSAQLAAMQQQVANLTAAVAAAHAKAAAFDQIKAALAAA